MCTQKDHLNFTSLFMMKMICCFHSDINELLAFLTGKLLHTMIMFENVVKYSDYFNSKLLTKVYYFIQFLPLFRWEHMGISFLY